MNESHHTKDLLCKERVSRKKMKLKLDGAILKRIVDLVTLLLLHRGKLQSIRVEVGLEGSNLLLCPSLLPEEFGIQIFHRYVLCVEIFIVAILWVGWGLV